MTDTFSKLFSPVFIVQQSWHHLLLKFDQIMTSTRKKRFWDFSYKTRSSFPSDFSWRFRCFPSFFNFSTVFENILSSGSAVLLLSLVHKGCLRNPDHIPSAEWLLLPFLCVMWLIMKVMDGTSIHQMFGWPTAHAWSFWDKVTGPHPLTLCRFPFSILALPASCSFYTSACSKPSDNFPSPSCFAYLFSSVLNHTVFLDPAPTRLWPLQWTWRIGLPVGFSLLGSQRLPLLCRLFKVNCPIFWHSDLKPKKKCGTNLCLPIHEFF